MDEWMGTAKTVRERMKNINSGPQATIRDIKNKKRLAENVVKAIGFIDDAVGIAANVLV